MGMKKADQDRKARAAVTKDLMEKENERRANMTNAVVTAANTLQEMVQLFKQQPPQPPPPPPPVVDYDLLAEAMWRHRDARAQGGGGGGGGRQQTDFF